jgi:hypothetical protein
MNDQNGNGLICDIIKILGITSLLDVENPESADLASSENTDELFGKMRSRVLAGLDTEFRGLNDDEFRELLGRVFKRMPHVFHMLAWERDDLQSSRNQGLVEYVHFLLNFYGGYGYLFIEFLIFELLVFRTVRRIIEARPEIDLEGFVGAPLGSLPCSRNAITEALGDNMKLVKAQINWHTQRLRHGETHLYVALYRVLRHMRIRQGKTPKCIHEVKAV